MKSYLPLVEKGVCMVYLEPHFLVTNLGSPLCVHHFVFLERSILLQFKPFAYKSISSLNVENLDARASTGLAVVLYDFSMTYPRLQSVDIDCGAHPASYSVGSGVLHVRNAAGACSCPLTSIMCPFYTSTPPTRRHGLERDSLPRFVFRSSTELCVKYFLSTGVVS
jgi:hypothetical protein